MLKDIDVNFMENYKALEQMKDYENITKIEGALNNFILDSVHKKPVQSKFGAAISLKHNQLKSLNEAAAERSVMDI